MELNRITKIKIDVGSLAPIDVVQTEVGVATAEQDIINAEAVVGLAEDQLRRDLNYEADTPTTQPHRSDRPIESRAAALRSRGRSADGAVPPARDRGPELHRRLEHAALRLLEEPDHAAARPGGRLRKERAVGHLLRHQRRPARRDRPRQLVGLGRPALRQRTSRTGGSGSSSRTRSSTARPGGHGAWRSTTSRPRRPAHGPRAGHRPQRAKRPPRHRDREAGRSTPPPRGRSSPSATSTPRARSTTTG